MVRQNKTTFEECNEMLEDVLTQIQDFREEFTSTLDDIEDMKVAVSEACTNAIKHSDDESVSITYTILENGLDIEIKDNGKGYDVKSIATPDLTQPKENGLGLFIIQTLMDDVKIESKDNQGTIIKMTKYLGVDI